ncbi:ATP-binding protein [Paenibacillus sp.]|uniref:ATP-binding protein n=1 Tax=Paenibacillus sp. TaxID=58172 RepID=UPI002D31EB90|nr:ATP-binding protein [Paenibacillus sp.]HZG88357.1 ATP-binding protein [Paenibacillus sp.]
MKDEPGGRPLRTWRFPSRWGEEKRILADLKKLARLHGFPEYRAEDLASAAAEACLNAVEHGNGLEPDRRVVVTFAFRRGFAVVRVYDQGKGLAFDAAREPRKASIIEGSPRGWGIALMRELADEVLFYHDERGFCAELRFRAAKEERQA